ncbi:flagellar basal body rod protein FlgB [Polynucleobacter sp. CS-Odin-A6]|uniref:flagellar basal body rod protein FlgB n=1 Tax=Polynucleobacter sp. CS-Odin-A6 TaxID=2689106 RepID=UPI001C0B7765|nr:flagellar basal body rod protein FlgB [Polynucleobacter sp. CS-Odin-A6]MBU3621866.1 flagellar basal body rod protein FlgB [Polynucleobacter sp. CS-Odin-A6]
MNKLDALFDFNATALRVRAQRQEILAANIANTDTPNFKARDIDFASSFKKALEANVSNAANNSTGSQSGALSLTTSHQKHISGDVKKGGISEEDLLYRPLIQSSVDGNSVDGEVERTAFVDNAIHYEANITMLNASIKDMNEALKPSA